MHRLTLEHAQIYQSVSCINQPTDISNSIGFFMRANGIDIFNRRYAIIKPHQQHSSPKRSVRRPEHFFRIFNPFALRAYWHSIAPINAEYLPTVFAVAGYCDKINSERMPFKWKSDVCKLGQINCHHNLHSNHWTSHSNAPGKKRTRARHKNAETDATQSVWPHSPMCAWDRRAEHNYKRVRWARSPKLNRTWTQYQSKNAICPAQFMREITVECSARLIKWSRTLFTLICLNWEPSNRNNSIYN